MYSVAEKKSEDGMLEELRAREAIRRNVVLYGVEEPELSTPTLYCQSMATVARWQNSGPQKSKIALDWTWQQ